MFIYYDSYGFNVENIHTVSLTLTNGDYQYISGIATLENNVYDNSLTWFLHQGNIELVVSFYEGRDLESDPFTDVEETFLNIVSAPTPSPTQPPPPPTQQPTPPAPRPSTTSLYTGYYTASTSSPTPSPPNSHTSKASQWIPIIIVPLIASILIYI
jgi:hypothetical protein